MCVCGEFEWGADDACVSVVNMSEVQIMCVSVVNVS